MKNKLLKLAIISSPILAIYGVAPVYIFVFRQVDFSLLLLAAMLSTVMIFIFWLINIYLANKIKVNWQKYILSYVLTSFLHFSITFSTPQLPFQESKIFIVYPLISILAINTIILIMLNGILLQYEKENAEIEIKNLKLANLEAQKQALLQQLQPHFLFNALSTLKSLINENTEEAEKYLLNLSEFLRYSVQAHSNELVNLEEELNFTKDYLSLQQVRFHEALFCDIDLPKTEFYRKIPVYALQTLVENAIKHNAFTNKKPLHIIINLENDRIKIANNRLPKQLMQPSGTGLENLNQRYKIIANKEIEVISNENEFVVYIYLL